MAGEVVVDEDDCVGGGSGVEPVDGVCGECVHLSLLYVKVPTAEPSLQTQSGRFARFVFAPSA
jgi:hypothetical protein